MRRKISITEQATSRTLQKQVMATGQHQKTLTIVHGVTLDVPHDWCVELPFDARGGHSHGYKAIGRDFPENSVGWYRKIVFHPRIRLGKTHLY